MIQNAKIIKIVDDFLTFWHSVEFSEEENKVLSPHDTEKP